MNFNNKEQSQKTVDMSSSIIFYMMKRFSDILYLHIQSCSCLINAIDPFEETKKKCLPQNIDHLTHAEKEDISIKIAYYTVVLFTIEKRDGSSFTGDIMNNLIVDNNGNLLQLIFQIDSESVYPVIGNIIQVTEYKINSSVLARKFDNYIS